jgi:hypothetical protein
MKRIETTIKELRRIADYPHMKKMRGQISGYLGELIVMSRLTRDSISVEHHGGQAGYDILCLKSGAKIDVKTSTPQEEYVGKTGIKNHGWALQRKNRKKPLKSTHIICVELDEKLKPKRFHVIMSSDVRKFPKPKSGRFKGVAHAYGTPIGKSQPGKSKAFKKAFGVCTSKKIQKLVTTVGKSGHLEAAIVV